MQSGSKLPAFSVLNNNAKFLDTNFSRQRLQCDHFLSFTFLQQGFDFRFHGVVYFIVEYYKRSTVVFLFCYISMFPIILVIILQLVAPFYKSLLILWPFLYSFYDRNMTLESYFRPISSLYNYRVVDYFSKLATGLYLE